MGGLLSSAICRRIRPGASDEWCGPFGLRDPLLFLLTRTELSEHLLKELVIVVAAYVPSDESVTLTIHSLYPSTIVLPEVYLDDTLLELKGQIRKSEGLPECLQKLQHHGRTLDDDGQRLYEIGLQHQSVLDLSVNHQQAEVRLALALQERGVPRRAAERFIIQTLLTTIQRAVVAHFRSSRQMSFE